MLDFPRWGFKVLGIILHDSLSTSGPCSTLWVIVPFFMKGIMYLQLTGFIMLFSANKILWEWQPYFITYLVCPFQFKLTVVLLKQFSQELCEPSWVSRGLNSLDKSYSYKSFWDNLFTIFGSYRNGWETMIFQGNLWDILRDIPLISLMGSGPCVFWPFGLSEVLAKNYMVTHLVCSLWHAFSSDFQILASFELWKANV